MSREALRDLSGTMEQVGKLQSLAQDIVIYGGTPGGIATAVSAARMGREVTLVDFAGARAVHGFRGQIGGAL